MSIENYLELAGWIYLLVFIYNLYWYAANDNYIERQMLGFVMSMSWGVVPFLIGLVLILFAVGVVAMFGSGAIELWNYCKAGFKA